MTIYLLCPTPSEVRKLRLVLRLSASIVPHVDVLLGIAPIVCFLMIGTSPLGTHPGRVAIFYIESTQKHTFMLLYLLTMLEYIGAAFCAVVMPPGTPGTKAGMMLPPIPPWRAV